MSTNKKEEWLRVLGKGMITLPKRWRSEMGIETGDIVKAKKAGNKVVIEPQEQVGQVPYRVYSAAEIDEFLEEEKLPDDLAANVQRKLSA
jgi:AbrB family looped-hinge helix DNA binding protein